MNEQVLSEEWENEEDDEIEPLRPAAIKYIIARVLDNANDAVQEARIKKLDGDSEFYDGKKFAYYEMLDTIKNVLITYGQDLKEFGLDINLEKELW